MAPDDAAERAVRPIIPARVRFRQNTPYSLDFDDFYFQPGLGPEESLAVFIEGADLPERLARLPQDGLYVVGETGFGSGLNCLLAADCFARHAPQSARLHLLSCEKHPLEPHDLERIHAAWPQLAALSASLRAQYPAPVPGRHALHLSQNIELVLLFGEAEAMLHDIDTQADSWLLDGFAPSRNPALWTEAMSRMLAARSRPGATLASFTVAGQVRRHLSQAGFAVSRAAGFGGKRQRLVARMPGLWQPRRVRRGTALVAGAGLAGATTARALADRGWSVRLVDERLPNPDQADNLAGVLYTTPGGQLDVRNRFYQAALVRAQTWLARHQFPRRADDGRLNDLLLRPPPGRAFNKLVRAIDSGIWPNELLHRDDEQTFRLRGAGYLCADRWCRRLIDHPRIELIEQRIERLHPDVGVMRGQCRDDGADAIIVCLGAQVLDLAEFRALKLRIVRGQISYCAASAASLRWTRAICHAGYLVPAIDGVHLIGATYDRDRPRHGADPADDQANLDQLHSFLPEHWRALGGPAIELVGQRVGYRLQGPDQLPVVGPDQRAPCGPASVYLNLAHGSRGLTHTPLCADRLACELAGLPASVEPMLGHLLRPNRVASV